MIFFFNDKEEILLTTNKLERKCTFQLSLYDSLKRKDEAEKE